MTTSNAAVNWSTGSVLRRAVGVDPRRTVGAAGLLVAHEIGEALVPVVFGVAIDAGIAAQDVGVFAACMGVLAIVFVVLSVSYRIGARWTRRLELQCLHDLRMAVLDRTLDPRPGWAGTHPGAILTIATSDVRRVSEVLGGIISAVGWAGAVVFAWATLFTLSLPLGALAVLAAPPLLLLLQWLAVAVERRSADEQAAVAEASSLATDLVTGLRVLTGIRAEAAAAARYRSASRRSMDASIGTAVAYAWHGNLTSVLTGLYLLAVTILAAALAISGDLSLGGLIASVGLTAYLLDPLGSLASLGSRVASARASARRIAAILAAPVVTTDAPEPLPAPVNGNLRFRMAAATPVTGLDLEIRAGTTVGIATREPTAAAAIVDLLARERDPETGLVELDGIRVDRLDPDDFRSAVVVAEHDAHLFEGSLLDNVAIPGTKPSDVEAAIAMVALDEIARRHPDGTGRALGERGRALSGGERQRVALARALALDPTVLVLHDPSTAIDAVTGARIAARVVDERQGRTTVVVTTDPTWLANVDRVVVIDGGRVVADGSPAALAGDGHLRRVVDG